MSIKRNRMMISRAAELRKDMTPQERKLWHLFLKRYPVKIYRQRPISSFIADFYCASAKLIIEVDGSQHYTDQGKAYDQERSQIIEGYGLEVLRFSNRQVDTEFQSVCDEIHQVIIQRKGQ